MEAEGEEREGVPSRVPPPPPRDEDDDGGDDDQGVAAKVEEMRAVVGASPASPALRALLSGAGGDVTTAVNHYFMGGAPPGETTAAPSSSSSSKKRGASAALSDASADPPAAKRARPSGETLAPVDPPCAYCGQCRALYFSVPCGHVACYPCLKERAGAARKTLECGAEGCGRDVPPDVVRNVLDPREFAAYSEAVMAAYTESNTVRCPHEGCGARVEFFDAGSERTPRVIAEKDERGQLLSREAWDHFCRFRVRCRACQQPFCASCGAGPYHIGRTCEGQAAYADAKHCRFCAAEIPGGGGNACAGEECVERLARSCTRALPCGHPCAGVKDEAECPACLQCSDQADEYCTVCYVEGLGAAPCVQLACGHVLHAHCARKKVETGPNGARITFGFLECPACKKPMENPALDDLLEAPLADKAEVERLARERVVIENVAAEKKVTDPSSRFYQKPLEFALASFAFYRCFKCTKIYFGGRRDCEQNASNEPPRPAAEYVCMECSDLTGVKCTIKAHLQYQNWKCRFCCSLATFRCWGTTSFCTPCHDVAARIIRKPQSSFKQCGGKDTCPLRVDHPPNGPDKRSECNVGCLICGMKRKGGDGAAGAAASSSSSSSSSSGAAAVAAAAVAAPRPRPAAAAARKGKRVYMCRVCGQPKAGHVCPGRRR